MMVMENSCEMIEGIVDEGEAWRELRQCGTRGLQGSGVEVNPEELPIGCGSLEDRPSMTASADRGIHQVLARVWIKILENFLEEHGMMGRSRSRHRHAVYTPSSPSASAMSPAFRSVPSWYFCQASPSQISKRLSKPAITTRFLRPAYFRR